MGDKSKIIWTDATWNPITGCNRISAGCKNCYALRMARRQAHMNIKSGKDNGYGFDPDHAFDVRFHPERLDQPLRWKKPRRIFVCSMGDLFHKEVEAIWQWLILVKAIKCPQHTFQVLTKRPERMYGFFTGNTMSIPFRGLENIWLGVTAENQDQADKRIPLLLETPAAKRFLSIEPMLGPVDINRYLHEWQCFNCKEKYSYCNSKASCNKCGVTAATAQTKKGIDLVIVGGESGPGARPMNPYWVRSVRDQCRAAGVPFMFKQWGEWAPSSAFSSMTIGPNTKRATFEDSPERMYKVGRKKAGRKLDGRTWDGVIE